MNSKERHLGSEYFQNQLVPSEQLELLVESLYEVAKMDTSYTGYVAALTITGEDLLVVQELELHVLMRLIYTADGQLPDPDVEIVSYIDRHGAYYPLLLRGRLVQSAGQVARQRALVPFADYLAQYFVRTEWPERGVAIGAASRDQLLKPALQVTTAERARLARWFATQGLCEATDGCDVPAFGRCPHGNPSWPFELGLI